MSKSWCDFITRLKQTTATEGERENELIGCTVSDQDISGTPFRHDQINEFLMTLAQQGDLESIQRVDQLYPVVYFKCYLWDCVIEVACEYGHLAVAQWIWSKYHPYIWLEKIIERNLQVSSEVQTWLDSQAQFDLDSKLAAC